MTVRNRTREMSQPANADDEYEKPSNERKLNAIKAEVDSKLIDILYHGRPGDHVITLRVNCGPGGGITGAKVGATFESPVRWEPGV